MASQPPAKAFDITRAAHAEIRVTDLDVAHRFYVDALGMVAIERTADRLYLGGYEETDKYSLVLRRASSGGLGHVAFRVGAPDDLDAIARTYTEHGLPHCWVEPNSVEAGQGRALRVQEPSGLPVEFYHDMRKRERLLQRFELHRGANIMRIDHFNWQVPDVQKAFDWWTQVMGCRCSEFTVTDDAPERLWAAWLRRKQNVHDLAIMNGTGPRLHHVAFWVQDRESVLRTCDILASMGMVDAIERGPGRHGISNAFFLYLRDPDGNRTELFTCDYMIPDADFAPIKWTLSDPRRATFWGHHPPRSWFEEASLVEDIRTGELLPVAEPLLAGRPSFVT
jgi:catechol 2,3-dioxygenase